MCIVRELVTKYKSLDVDFWNGKTSCMFMESREMWRDQGEVGRRSVNVRFLDGFLMIFQVILEVYREANCPTLLSHRCLSSSSSLG